VSVKTTLSSANQVAAAGKQLLFHRVLAAARRQLAGSGLIGERLAEPSHGAVEMMQLKGLSTLDPVIGSPRFRSAVQARHKQPVEHCQKHRALGGKLELRLRPAPLTLRGSRPHPTAARRAAPVQSAGTLHWAGLSPRPATDHRTLRQPGDGAGQTIEITARNGHFLAPEIGDDVLLGATVLAYVLEQVDLGVGDNALVAGEHTLSI
jgi:hypothetical protein